MRLDLPVLILPTHEFAFSGTGKSTLGNTVPLSGMKLHTACKPKGRYRLVETTNEDAVGTRNELELMQ